MEISQEYIDTLNDNPLYNAIGIRIEKAGDGKAESRLIPARDVCWPFPGQPHGGVLFTVMDTTMAWAVLTRIDDGYNCTTINLDIEYTSPARGAYFLCKSWVLHKTGRICFVRSDIMDSDGGLVCFGHASFRVVKFDMKIPGSTK